MKRSLLFSAIGLSAYLIFLLHSLPAAQVWRFAAEPLAEQVPALQLHGPNGSLWRGGAEQLAWDGLPVGRMDWQLAHWPLLRGRLHAEVSLQQGDGHLQGQLRYPLKGEQLQLKDWRGQWPIQQLAVQLPTLPVALDGQLGLQLASLQLGPGGWPQALQGRLSWHQARLLMGEAIPLGDLSAELSRSDDGRLQAHIRDHGGPLRIEAELSLQPGGRYRIDGRVGAAEGADARLPQTLALLGRADSDGMYPLVLQGNMPVF